MEEKDFQDLYSKTKTVYFEIKSVHSPHFQDDKVFFDRIGFVHMIYKGKMLREKKDQINRFKSFKYVITVLLSESSTLEYRESEKYKTKAMFWGLSLKIRDKLVTVVIRQVDSGKKHFYSVMSR